MSISERRKEIKRRRHRRKKLTLLSKRLKKATVSEKGVIATKIRNLTSGAEVIIDALAAARARLIIAWQPHRLTGSPRSAAGCRLGLFRNRALEGELAVAVVDPHGTPSPNRPLSSLAGQRVLDLLLDHPLQRPGAVGRVVALARRWRRAPRRSLPARCPSAPSCFCSRSTCRLDDLADLLGARADGR